MLWRTVIRSKRHRGQGPLKLVILDGIIIKFRKFNWIRPPIFGAGFNWSHWGFILKHFSSGLREIPQVSEVIYGPPFECGMFWKEHMRVITIKTPFKEAFLCKTQWNIDFSNIGNHINRVLFILVYKSQSQQLLSVTEKN